MNPKLSAVCCHLSFLLAFVFPGASVLAAWWMWRRTRSLSAFADQHGQEALNFQLTILLAVAISWLLIFSVVGLVTMPLVLAFNALAATVACVRASRGEAFRYPGSFRVLGEPVRPSKAGVSR